MTDMQHEDPDLHMIFSYLEKSELPSDEKKARRLVLESDHYTILNGVLYFVDNSRGNQLRIAAPSAILETLLQNHSQAGHFAAKGVYEKLARRYWWEGMYADVVKHCRACLTCASYRGAGCRSRQPLKPIEVGGPFERVGVDMLDMPPTERENRYIVVFVDYLTMWVEAFPTADQTSDTVARLLVERVTLQHGAPKGLLSVHGPSLLSSLILDICRLMGTKKINTSAYHPQTDGLVENFNLTLRAMIAKHAKKLGRNWDVYLPQLLFAYRTKPH